MPLFLSPVRLFRFSRPAKTFLTLAAIASTIALRAADAPNPPAPKDGYTIANCINTFDPAKTVKTDAGFAYWFADRDFTPDANTIKLSVVGPGKATHAPHRHAEDEFFFVLEGQAEFYLDGERRMVGPMTSLYAPSWHEHGIRNAGSGELRYLVLKKAPKKG